VTGVIDPATGGRSDQPIGPRIEAALARLGAEYEPPPGWEARVLAATAMLAPCPPWWRRWRWRWRWRWSIAPGLALAGAAAALVAYLAPGGEAPALALHVDIAHRAPMRGPDAVVGDVAHIVASGGGERELWIYRDEAALVMRCPGAPACRIADGSTAVDFALTQVGRYTVVALARPAALSALPGTYDEDLAAARRAGAELQQQTIDVP
jgi:hypothetical protein